MKSIKPISIFLCFLLIGCDDPSDQMGVGAVIPGGYVVTERVAHKNMNDCIAIANLRLKSGNGYRKTENRQDDGTWLSTVGYPEKDAIQTCINDKNGNVMFTEAKK